MCRRFNSVSAHSKQRKLKNQVYRAWFFVFKEAFINRQDREKMKSCTKNRNLLVLVFSRTSDLGLPLRKQTHKIKELSFNRKLLSAGSPIGMSLASLTPNSVSAHSKQRKLKNQVYRAWFFVFKEAFINRQDREKMKSCTKNRNLLVLVFSRTSDVGLPLRKKTLKI